MLLFFNVFVNLNMIFTAEEKRVDTLEFWLNRKSYSENKEKKMQEIVKK